MKRAPHLHVHRICAHMLSTVKTKGHVSKFFKYIIPEKSCLFKRKLPGIILRSLQPPPPQKKIPHLFPFLSPAFTLIFFPILNAFTSQFCKHQARRTRCLRREQEGEGGFNTGPVVSDTVETPAQKGRHVSQEGSGKREKLIERVM